MRSSRWMSGVVLKQIGKLASHDTEVRLNPPGRSCHDGAESTMIGRRYGIGTVNPGRRLRTGARPDSCGTPKATPPASSRRTITMRKTLSLLLTLLLLISAVPLLGACHTTAGAGEDISATGHAITNDAERHTP